MPVNTHTSRREGLGPPDAARPPPQAGDGRRGRERDRHPLRGRDPNLNTRPMLKRPNRNDT